MLKVGLTGGIGAGKSSVSQRFAELGVPVIDTDDISHRLTGPEGVALPMLRQNFSTAFRPDGSLDRAALRRVVFADPGARARLEGLLHPLIRQEVEAALHRLDAPYCIVVVPLLVESGDYDKLLHRVAVVDSPETSRIERVMARSGLDRDEILAIIAAQASRKERLARADYVLNNSTTLTSLRTQVDVLHQRLRCEARNFDSPGE